MGTLASIGNLILPISSVGAAIATVAAVILALYLQIYIVRSKRPILALAVSLDPVDEDIVALTSPTSHGLWVRVRVSAQPGRSTAKNVRVRLVQATRPADAKNKLPVPAREFSWADSSESSVEIP